MQTVVRAASKCARKIAMLSMDFGVRSNLER